MLIKESAIVWFEGLLSRDSDAFAQLFSENGVYADPAFGLVRRGREFVRLHHRKWHAAIPDFVGAVERILIDNQTAIIQYVAEGTFSGEPLTAIQPTFRSFKARVVILLDYDFDGKIVMCTEYYDRSIMPGGMSTPFTDDI